MSTTTPEEMAATMDGSEYRDFPTREVRQAAHAAGLVIVYGASDDLIEFEGAVSDELGCFEGGSFMFDAEGLLVRDEDDTDEEIARYVLRFVYAREIRANWDPGDGYSWTYTTDIPHATFDVMEDGEVYCRGMVFRLSDAEVPAVTRSHPGADR